MCGHELGQRVAPRLWAALAMWATCNWTLLSPTLFALWTKTMEAKKEKKREESPLERGRGMSPRLTNVVDEASLPALRLYKQLHGGGGGGDR